MRELTKVHWACLIPSILLSFVIIGIPSLISKIIQMCTTELGYTYKNLMGKRGLVNTKVMNSPLNKVNSVSVQSGLFGKIFGYGTVSVTTSSGDYFFNYIKSADSFRSHLMQAIDNYEQDKMKQSAYEMAAAMKGSLDK